MTLTASVWAISICLLASSTFAAVRRRVTILAVVMGTMGATSLISVPLRVWDRPHFWIISWAYQAIQFVGISALAAYIIGIIVRMRRPVQMIAPMIISAAIIGWACAVMFSQSTTLSEKLLDAGMTGNAAVALVLAGSWAYAWGWQGRRLENPWKWIAAFLILFAAWQGIVTALWAVWPGARHLFWLGEILCLAGWNYLPHAEVRVGLGVRAEATEKIMGRAV